MLFLRRIGKNIVCNNCLSLYVYRTDKSKIVILTILSTILFFYIIEVFNLIWICFQMKYFWHFIAKCVFEQEKWHPFKKSNDVIVQRCYCSNLLKIQRAINVYRNGKSKMVFLNGILFNHPSTLLHLHWFGFYTTSIKFNLI